MTDRRINANWLTILDGLYMHSHKHIIIYTLALPWNHVLTGLVAVLDGELHRASSAQPPLHRTSWTASYTEPRQHSHPCTGRPGRRATQSLISTATPAQAVLDGELHRASSAQPPLHRPSWTASCTEPRQHSHTCIVRPGQQAAQSLINTAIVNIVFTVPFG